MEAQLEAFCRQCAGFVTGLHYLHLNEVEVDGDRPSLVPATEMFKRPRGF